MSLHFHTKATIYFYKMALKGFFTLLTVCFALLYFVEASKGDRNGHFKYCLQKFELSVLNLKPKIASFYRSFDPILFFK